MAKERCGSRSLDPGITLQSRDKWLWSQDSLKNRDADKWMPRSPWRKKLFLKFCTKYWPFSTSFSLYQEGSNQENRNILIILTEKTHPNFGLGERLMTPHTHQGCAKRLTTRIIRFCWGRAGRRPRWAEAVLESAVKGSRPGALPVVKGWGGVRVPLWGERFAWLEFATGSVGGNEDSLTSLLGYGAEGEEGRLRLKCPQQSNIKKWSPTFLLYSENRIATFPGKAECTPVGILQAEITYG